MRIAWITQLQTESSRIAWDSSRIMRIAREFLENHENHMRIVENHENCLRIMRFTQEIHSLRITTITWVTESHLKCHESWKSQESFEIQYSWELLENHEHHKNYLGITWESSKIMRIFNNYMKNHFRIMRITALVNHLN